MNKKLRPLLLLLLPALSSCGGFSLDYIVEGNKYNSYIFGENYYRHWDNELKKAEIVDTTNVTNFIIKYADIGNIDPLMLDPESRPTADKYGHTYNLMRMDQSFYYGVQSKLFDGEIYCEGYYQKRRVQTDPNGFSVRFSKESDELSYFATQFKATTNNQYDCYPVGESVIPSRKDDANHDHAIFHNSEIKLHTTIYTKNNSKIVGHEFISNIVFDNNHTNDGSYYVFYAFDLKEYELSRMVGFSFTFDIVYDELIEWNKGKKIDGVDIPLIDYALFFYEVFVPYTYWH